MHYACILLTLKNHWKRIMPTLQIRQLPDNIYKALKNAAKREKRSLSQQAIITLERGLGVSADYRERRKKILEENKREAHLWKKWANVDVAGWIREDRDNR